MRIGHLAAVLLAACCLAGSTCRAQSEFRLPFAAIERMLASQAFTREGRLYLRGESSAKCSYAYLQDPKVSAESGKLKMHAHFTGRSALNLFGQCVGLGDSFEMTILSSPYYQEGSLRLRDVSVTCGANGVYARAACLSIGRSLERDFRHDLRGAAARLLDGACVGKQAAYKPMIEEFDVTGIRVTPQAVILSMRVRLTLQ